jgi:hypothetical protein
MAESQTNRDEPTTSQLAWSGRWVQAIPIPFYQLFRKECACGERFWTFEGYRAHYAYRHIVLGELP